MKCLILALCAASCGAAARGQQPAQPTPGQDAPGPVKKANARPAAEPAAPPEPFDKAAATQLAGQCVRLETEEGAVEVEMLAEAAPETVRNFLNLAATGAYDTTVFGRVVKGFVIQGGDLATREKLTPELARRAQRTIPDEPNPVKHVRGVVSMARTSEPNSATTSFFILVGDGSHLDGTFSAFGRVRSGMEVVDRINQAPVDGEKPLKPVRLTRATVAPCRSEQK
ncbi:MAG: peptidylprolyl isomerase [Acidobacteriota bacterium]|nr:peptidylprolyl isomerase [Acidobacteriota bacterium]